MSVPPCAAIMLRTLRFLALLALLLLTATTARAQSVTISWDPNSEPDITGYVVFYGTQPGVYTVTQPVGNVTIWTVSNLVAGQNYCFAVQAVNTSGLTSPLSEEKCTSDSTVPGGGGSGTDPGGGGTDPGGSDPGGGTATTGPASLTGLTAGSATFRPSVPVTWTATATGGPEPIEYRFWLFNMGTGVWSLLRDYSQASDVTWTPPSPGTYVIQVWARRTGVTTSRASACARCWPGRWRTS